MGLLFITGLGLWRLTPLSTIFKQSVLLHVLLLPLELTTNVENICMTASFHIHIVPSQEC